MLTKTLTVTALLVAAATLTHAQPSKAGLKATALANLSYRSEGGIIAMKMGLDVHPSGAAYAFKELSGQVSQARGQVSALDLQRLQAAADALFSAQARSLSKGSGTLSHTIMRRTAGATQYFETYSPKGQAAVLVQLLQQAHAEVLANGTKAALPPVRVRPDRAPLGGNTGVMGGGSAGGLVSQKSGRTNTVPPIIVCPKGPVGKNSDAKAGAVGSKSGPASKGGRTGTLGGASKNGPASQGGRVGTLGGSKGGPASQGGRTGTLGGASKSGPASQGGRVGTLGGSKGGPASKGGRTGTVNRPVKAKKR